MNSTDPAAHKVSGLKPPSKISRPCSVVPKPALPTAATPKGTNNGTASVLRKMSDGMLRRKMEGLEEVHEEEESELADKSPVEERKLSCGSVFSDAANSRRGSIDINEMKKKKTSDAESQWEHARRLSEAGVRRTSDASIILTEDTDSFIIGDKVWVGGTKPGQIAYIGETQFAPGEWAGVVLDEPIGKNDGSVAGIRYFQCEPKRGVFSRLTRLTREPLSQTDVSNVLRDTPPRPSDTASVRSSSSRHSLPSPAGSTKDLVLKKSPTSTYHVSPGSTSSQSISDLKIGDRVIVMSSMGSKAGVLRYMGTTDFAPGEWCGVELDDPLGKNDGSVGDKRYFECQPKCGLFAPVHKVSRSPASRRSSSCMLHRSGTPASGIRRAGSKESVTSISSSIASSVRSSRDTLREKDLQIEKLLKERDLERAEVTRAANQADEAEQKLASLRQEFQKFQEDTNSRIREFEDLLARVQQEKSELLGQLEDEKRKFEDLQFQFEEENISKADIERRLQERELTNAAHEEKIQLLEQKLAEERRKAEVLEQDSNKLFEAEEALACCKHELEVLHNELDEIKRLSKEQEKIKTGESNLEIEKLQKELNEVQKNYQQTKDASLKLEEEFHAKLDLLSKDHECAKQALEDTLRMEIKTHENNVKQKSEELDKALSHLKEKDNVISELQKESECIKISLQQVKEDLESTVSLSRLKEQELRNEIELLHLREQELHQASEKYVQELTERKDIMVNLEQGVRERDLDIIKLKGEVSTLKEGSLASSEELKQTHVKEIKEKESKICELKALIDQRDEEVQQLRGMCARFEQELQGEKQSVKKLEADVTGLRDKLVTSEESLSTQTAQSQSLQLEIGDSQRKVQATEEKCETLSQQKQKLEDYISELMSTSNDSSVQLGKLNSELRQKEKELDAANEQISSSNQEIESTKQRLFQASEQMAKFEEELGQKLNEYAENIQKLEQELKDEKAAKLDLSQELEKAADLCKRIEKEAKSNLEQMALQTESLQHDLNSKLEMTIREKKELTQLLETFQQESLIKEENFKQQLEKLSTNYEEVQGELLKKCSQGKELEEEYKKKLKQLSNESQEKEQNLRIELEAAKQKLQFSEEHTSKKEEECSSRLLQLTELEEARNNLERIVSEKVEMVNGLGEELEKLQAENTGIKISFEELNTMKETLQEKVNKLNCEVLSLNSGIESLRKEKYDSETELSHIKERAAEVSSELEMVKQTAAKSEKLNVEKDKEIVKLSEEVAKLHGEKLVSENSLANLATQLAKLSDEKLAAEKLSLEKNDKIDSLTQDVGKLQENFEKHRNELQSKLEQTQKEAEAVQDLQKSLESERLRIDTLQEKLSFTEVEKNQLLEQCQSLQSKCKGLDESESMREILKKEVQQLTESAKIRDEELSRFTRNDVERVADIAEKEKINNELKLQLEMEEQRSKQYQSTIHRLEQELQIAKLREMQLGAASQLHTNGPHKEDNFQHNEREFLNSVIVDQQKKIEELNAHIELLNRGIAPLDAKDLLLEGIVDRVVAPRIYCDICEVFDAHETEDCPRQATESPPPHPKHKPGSRALLSERPYCEICEVFGHSTADCDDAETF